MSLLYIKGGIFMEDSAPPNTKRNSPSALHAHKPSGRKEFCFGYV
jgi:hypothetical protein